MTSVGTENSRVQNDLFRPHFFVHKNNFDSIKRGFRNPFKKTKKNGDCNLQNKSLELYEIP